ncbi:hypothetical protein FJNA_07300 [Thermus sp. FJN-A]
MKVVPVHTGFPGRSHRGYLGLSGAYLVVGRRLLLYDTLGFGEREGLYGRLEALGFSPLDVASVVLSHLHYDHAANADLFPWAEVYVHEAELHHAERVAKDPRLDPACLAHLPKVLPRLRAVPGGLVEKGLALLHLPGHTPGLLGLAVEGVGALVSDAVKSRFDLEGPPAPPCLDPEAALKSRERLWSFPRLFPGHDVPLRREGGRFVPEGEARLEVILPHGTQVALKL